MLHTIRVAQYDAAFSCSQQQPVLDGALQAGYEIPYSCRSGICGSCRGQILSGQVSGGRGEGVLSEEERREGNVLLCQARPCSDLTIAVRDIHRREQSATKTVSARIYRMTRAAPDVTILQLRFPAGVKARFKAGQYLRVHLEDGTFRNFSMANPPQQNDGAELHIRHVPGGKFSQRAADGLAVGQALGVSLPFGDFFMREKTDAPIVLLASGTGFAPIKSIVEDAMRRRLSREMVLYWGARCLADLYRIDLPRKWATQLPWFRFVPVLSGAGPATGWDGRTGLVHHAVMEDFTSLSRHEVYACGAAAMVHAARQEFTGERDLGRDAFYCDAFVPTATVDPDTTPAPPSAG